ncbi:3-keto-disaccharide hydrolase [Gimesia sp.]|uniref:3-keto-disaccharide hydrolase n=1 Tax=Gimesia sp. TaxID=2024833 RepID=UPI003A9390BF
MKSLNRLLPLLSLVCLLAGCSDSGPTEAQKQEAADEVSAIDLPEKTLESLFDVEDGFTLLNLKDFEIFNGKTKEPVEGKNWSEVDGVISCQGTPRGYLYSNESFGNCTIRLEYRFPVAAEKNENPNTGFLFFITGENRVWPKCLEVQGKFAEMAHIKSNSKEILLEVTDNEAAREKARRPIGEWNTIEVVCKDGALTSVLNGTQIATSKPSELKSGFFGIQSEGDAVEFRNIRVQKLTD